MRTWLTAFLVLIVIHSAHAADIYVRFRIAEPAATAEDRFKVSTHFYIHVDPWGLTGESKEVAGNAWSEWMDLTKVNLHGRLNREGGVAEWPSMRLTVDRVGPGE